MKRVWGMVLFALWGISTSLINGQNIVSVSGRTILLNNEPYYIKGICYNPVPKNDTARSWNTLTHDLELMVEAGINTIRVYLPIDNKEVLDEIAAAGIKIIMGFGYNDGGTYDILSGSFIDYIKMYKNHDAILFWEFGNEYNYHPEWFDDNLNTWYVALNNAALDAFAEDPNHPVGTAHGELPDSTARAMCPDIDIWGMNVYRWNNPSTIFKEWESVSSKPMYLSEAGADRYMTAERDGYAQGENQEMHADATEAILNSTLSNTQICSGIAIFEFSDEWWKAGNPGVHDLGGTAPNSTGVPYDGAPNEEYWGIVDIDRNKTLAFDVVKSLFNSVSTNVRVCGLEEGVIIYSNSSQGSITIDFSYFVANKVDFAILNMEGKTIFKGQNAERAIILDNFSSGVYCLLVESDQGKIVKDFVVQ
jgi:exo-beta-1,3-glucanase (GH17 family)